MKNVILYGILLASVVLFSCKKDNNTNDDDDVNPPPPVDNCRLVKSSRENFSDKIFEYDAQKRLIKTKVGNTIRTLSYNGNTVTVEVSENNGQSISSTRTITYNNDKMATNVRIDYPGGHWENTAYEYEGTRVVKRIYTHPITNPSVTTYEWANGNLVKEISSSGSVSSTYSYDTNELFQDTDYMGNGYYEFGIRVFVTKNRVNKATSQSATYDITHFENQNGKVRGYKVDITPGGDYTVNHSFQCD